MVTLAKYLIDSANGTILFYEPTANMGDEKSKAIIQQCNLFKEWIREYNRKDI